MPIPNGGTYEIGNEKPLTILAGPCAMESRDHALMTAERLKKIGENVGLNIVYKSSYDKANRTSIHSPRGIGLDKALPIFEEIRNDVAAAKTGKVINVKKGQFLAPEDMGNVLNKVVEGGNPNVMACERGASFGYNTLVTDFRGISTMKTFGSPVVFDATHSDGNPS